MANEYLKRTPTSTGNRKKWTWAGWLKINTDFGSSDYNTVWSVAAGTSGDNSDRLHLYHYSDGRWVTTGTTSFSAVFTAPGGSAAHSRDPNSWMHVCLSCDTTVSSLSPDKIQRFWLNGVEYIYDDSGNIGQNADLAINGPYEHYIGSRNSTPQRVYDGQMFDVYLVDGQALTPEVFGFYKDGNGYISAGTLKATDFRPGQWSPRLPKSIKHTINRSGGFGANGFYLPMNDSSNPGADFHCDPDSIIKLKGEDLPQPRNGAPTTSDAYVSQLRTDPYAANLVLAVPGISTATGSNLIDNGNFDSSNLSDWTVTDNTQSWDNGQLQINRTGGSGGTSYQAFTTVAGQRYTVSGTVNSSGSRGDIRVYDGTGFGGTTLLSMSGTASQTKNLTGSFTASSTTSTLGFSVDNNGTTIYVDNIVVKQEDAPRDYSADIKGSGTNKTLTPNGAVGIGYELGGYYGSAMTFDGTNDYLQIPDSDDFNMGTGDFTLECWINSIDDSDYQGIFGSFDYDNAQVVLQISDTGVLRFINPNVISPTGSSDLQTGQWNHIVMERYDGRLYGYVNGVAEINIAYTNSIDWGHSNNSIVIGVVDRNDYPGQYEYKGSLQDLRLYKGVAKYKGGFDVPKPYTPVNFESNSWRVVPDTCKNNFATLNPLIGAGIATGDNVPALKGGNLYLDNANQTWTVSNVGVSSGKYYAEFMMSGGSFSSNIGVCGDLRSARNEQQYHTARGISYIRLSSNAVKKNYDDVGSTEEVDAAFSYESGSIVSVTIDFDNKEIKYYKNGTLIRTDSTPATYTPVDSALYFLVFRTNDGANPVGSNWADVSANFGQNPTFSGKITAGTNTDGNGKGLFKYAPPSGFLALCEDNLPTPAIADPGEHFKTVLYTGDGNAGLNVSGVGFQPDMVWIKNRDTARSHNIYDSVRGAAKRIQPDLTNIESDIAGVSAFNSNGFSLGNGTDDTNFTAGENYVAWCWKAGGPSVTNNAGSITSQVSANQDAGFSIATWSGDGGAGNDIGHGLGKKPSLWIVKRRNVVNDWPVYTDVNDGSLDFLYLNLANPIGNSSLPISELTSSTIPVGNVNGENYVAYIWAEVKNFSKVGTYVGNGDDNGPMIECGFKPAWVIVKRITTGANEGWPIYDSSRGPSNPNPKGHYSNDSGVENDASGRYKDFLSNGFKIRGTSGEQNTSGIKYLYMAFAESPFQTANAK